MQRSVGLLIASGIASGALLVAGGASASDVAGFTLETGSPDALCPALETAREVVGRRLGSLLVDGRRGWHARYTIAHAPSGNPRDFVRLELFNPDGGVELVRDLPMAGESCRTMAEVIALVLDRHFRGLVATENQAQNAAKTPAPARVSATHSSKVASPAVSSRRSSSAFASAPRLSLLLADSLPESRTSVGLRAWVPGRSPFSFGAAVTMDLVAREEALALGGYVETRQWSGRAFVAWSVAAEPWIAHVGPAFAVTLEAGETRGLPESHGRLRAINAVGLDAGFLVALGPRWFLSSAAQADWRMAWASGRFTVDGRDVLAPRPFGFSASVGFGYAFVGAP